MEHGLLRMINLARVLDDSCELFCVNLSSEDSRLSISHFDWNKILRAQELLSEIKDGPPKPGKTQLGEYLRIICEDLMHNLESFYRFFPKSKKQYISGYKSISEREFKNKRLMMVKPR
jgi:hypothetical protein